MTDRPFAIHVTWTTYGTWLPGDARGYVSNTRRTEGGFTRKRNAPGTLPAANDPLTEEHAWKEEKHEAVWLTREQTAVVAVSLVQAAADTNRNWQILRAAIMTNHTHVVVASCPNDGPAVRRILKGVTQAALSRFNGSPRRWWTADGSNRYKHDERAIEAAIDYDANQDGMLAGVAEMKPFVVEPDGTIRFIPLSSE